MSQTVGSTNYHSRLASVQTAPNPSVVLFWGKSWDNLRIARIPLPNRSVVE
jgi:hypothetical protein